VTQLLFDRVAWRTYRGTMFRAARHVNGRLAAAAVLLALAALIPGSAAAAGPPLPATTSPTLAELVGQRMLVSFHGTTPDSALLARIKAGYVGGVILFGSTITGATQLAHLTAKLQAAATAAGRPPLLVATDQEGGLLRRLTRGPSA